MMMWSVYLLSLFCLILGFDLFNFKCKLNRQLIVKYFMVRGLQSSWRFDCGRLWLRRIDGVYHRLLSDRMFLGTDGLWHLEECIHICRRVVPGMPSSYHILRHWFWSFAQALSDMMLSCILDDSYNLIWIWRRTSKLHSLIHTRTSWPSFPAYQSKNHREEWSVHYRGTPYKYSQGSLLNVNFVRICFSSHCSKPTCSRFYWSEHCTKSCAPIMSLPVSDRKVLHFHEYLQEEEHWSSFEPFC